MAIKKLTKEAYASIVKGRDLRDRSPETSAAPVVGTAQQVAIWRAMVDTTANIAVRARAGTGKTFTMIHGLGLMQRKYLSSRQGKISTPRRMAFVAFNRSIRDELKAKVPAGVDASTLHSMGYALIRRHFGDKGVSYQKHKTAECLREYINNRKPPFTLLTPIEKIVSLCKSYGFTAEGKQAVRPSDLDMLVDTYDIQLYKQRKAIYELVPAVLDLTIRKSNVVDYDDMIYLPVVCRSQFITPDAPYDVLVVDESQDLNIAQQELAIAMGRRLIIVGDDRQAIYGFRGADPNAMEKLIKSMGGPKGTNVELLTLTATRRCPTTHVALANQVVDDFEAMPDAPTGSVNVVTVPTFDVDTVLDNDTIIVCRTNAPLIKKAFQLIAKNIRCRIQGRDFSAGIVDLVKQVVYDAPLKYPDGDTYRKDKTSPLPISPFLTLLDMYEERERSKLSGSKSELINRKLERLADKCECIRVLAGSPGIDSTDKLLNRIDTLFAKTEQEEEDICRAKIRDFVLLSSIHRVKGMEAKRIVILRPDLLPHPMAKQPWEQTQEENLAYVAFTRSLNEIWVCGELPSYFLPLHLKEIDGKAYLPRGYESTDFGYKLGYGLLNEPKPIQSSSPKTTNETPEQIKKRYRHENISTHRFKFRDRWEANEKAYREVVEAEEIRKVENGEVRIVETTEAEKAKSGGTAKGDPRAVRGSKESGTLPVLRKESRRPEFGGILRKPPTRTSGEDEKVYGSLPQQGSGKSNSRPTVDRKEAGPKAESKAGRETLKALREIEKQVRKNDKAARQEKADQGRLTKPAPVKQGRKAVKAMRPVSFPEKSPRKAVKEYGKTRSKTSNGKTVKPKSTNGKRTVASRRK